MAARIKAGDARRFFQNGSAIDRLGLDQGFNLALADQRGGARAGGGIGEQELHVAGARILAVYLVVRAFAAFDAAHDLQLV